jgi:heterodisulfide reductase subunit C
MNEIEKKVIKSSEIDPKFKYEISRAHGGEKVMRCFQCGTCTSDCPVARFSDTYRPAQIIRMAQLGLKQRVLKSDTLWLCASCFTCTDRCPQDVEVASVIRVIESGYAYKIPELRLRKRESLGLPPLPKGNPESIRKSLNGVAFVKRLEKKVV